MSFQGLMKGKRGLIMGVANQHSIAWGIAQALHDDNEKEISKPPTVSFDAAPARPTSAGSGATK